MHKIYLTIISVLLIICTVFGYIIYSGRISEDRIVELNQQLRTEISSTRLRITELERIQQIDKRTISNLRGNQQRLEETNKQLADLLQQQGNSISTIESGSTDDRKDLQRLREIIEALSKAK